jgi:hypothetical protein
VVGASTEVAVDSPDLQQQQQPTTYKAAMPLAGSAAADASTNTGPIPFFSLREFYALQQELGPLGISNPLGGDAISRAQMVCVEDLILGPHDTYTLRRTPGITQFHYWFFPHVHAGLAAWSAHKAQYKSAAAAFVLPYRPSAAWWQHTAGMEMVRFYPPGYHCFEDFSGQSIPAAEAVCVMLDDPVRHAKQQQILAAQQAEQHKAHVSVSSRPVEVAEAGNMLSQVHFSAFGSSVDAPEELIYLKGSHGSQKLKVLLDGGSHRSYLDTDVAVKLGRHPKPLSRPLTVRFADKHLVSVDCFDPTFKLRLGPFTFKPCPCIMKLSDDYDAILGKDWLAAHNPTVNWTTNHVELNGVTLPLAPPPQNDTCTIGVISAERLQSQWEHGRVACVLLATVQELLDMPVDDACNVCRSFTAASTAVPAAQQSPVPNPLADLHPDDVPFGMDADALLKALHGAPVALQSQLRQLLASYSDVFAPLPNEPPPFRPGLDFSIHLEPGTRPVHRAMYRLSPMERQEAKRQVMDLVKRGWARGSTSAWSAPILFVRKHDGSLRMCLDYRGLNACTQRDRYPIPRIDDLLDILGNHKL